MKIVITEDGKKHTMPVPATAIVSLISTDGSEADKEQLKKISKAIKACRKTFPGLKLVEINSDDGEIVEIYL